jgi:16S rRNA (guanine(966)-N(2))-methyltransferase RsmD
MRIIAGEFRRRVIKTPPDASVTRPIPDRVKESLFSLLRGHCEGANVFDGFAGTGAIGLEAISRGAQHCVCVEQDKNVVEILRGNVRTLGVESRCDVVAGDALGVGALARAKRPLTLAFLDPPYPLMRDPVGSKRIFAQLTQLIDLLTPDGFAILRTPWPLIIEELPGHVPAAQPLMRKKRKEPRSAWKRELDRKAEPEKSPKKGHPRGFDEAESEWFDADDPQLLEVETDEPAEVLTGRKSEQVAELRLPNAQGPETHVYRGTALHFYMRKRT